MNIICKCGHSYSEHDRELFCMNKDCDCIKDREQVLFSHITELAEAGKLVVRRRDIGDLLKAIDALAALLK